MNTYNETSLPETTDDAIAHVLAKATHELATWSFTFIVPSTRQVKSLRAVIERRFPDMKHTITRDVAESCSHHEVHFQAAFAVSSDDVQNRIKSMYELVENRSAYFWDWGLVEVASARRNEQKSNLKMMCRTEFMHDAIELRIALAPYVLHWTDKTADMTEDMAPVGTRQTALHGGDRDVEFEACDRAPCLDHLRWFINQIPDMHVPAQSLHTEERYTGARIPHELIEEMKPPVAIVQNMLATAKRVAKWRGSSKSLQAQLVRNIEEHLTQRLW